MAFKEIDSQHHIFWLYVDLSKEYIQKPRGNTIACRFLQGIWFHTQRKDGANTTSIEDLTEAIGYRDELRERERESGYELMTMMMIYIYIYMRVCVSVSQLW